MAALAPLLAVVGAISTGAGLFLAAIFLAFAYLILKSIADILGFLIDPFDHYEDTAPTTPQDVGDASSAPENPASCEPSEDAMIEIMASDLELTPAEQSALVACGVQDVNKLALIVDFIAFVPLAFAMAMTLMYTLIGCIQGLNGFVYGYLYGVTASLETEFMSWLLFAVPIILTCHNGGTESEECWSAFVNSTKGLAIPDPFVDAAWILYLTCQNASVSSIQECLRSESP